MNTHVRARRLFPLMLMIAALVAPASAQNGKSKNGKAPTAADLATAKPGRDPNQPIDEEYTKGIKKYTTETFFKAETTGVGPSLTRPPGITRRPFRDLVGSALPRVLCSFRL